MKKGAPLLLLTLSLALASCSGSGGPSGGLLGLVTGGVLGHLVDGQSTSSNSSSVAGTTVAGSTVTNGTSSVAAGTSSNQNDFFGDNKGAIVGAAAGAASGLITDQFRQGEIQKRYDEGYAKAKSDAIKEFYWIKRDAQKAKGNGDDAPVQYRYYEVEVPAHTTSDGVFIDRHKRVIEVVE
ncbi:MAG: hypothetical protein JWO94_3551 [Verrucomicrobiaceae bacterium]|nr:hypothetical protein [Verrucomicrobiaceae bacterium]